VKHRRGVIIILALSAALLAQQQVNTQVQTQVNPELNGRGMTNSVRYSNVPTSYALPSEVRYAYWKSGALPSEIQMNAAAIGPMAPGGPIAYVPPPPSYQTKPATPIPAPQTFSTGATIRYSAPSNSYTPPAYSSSAAVAPSMVSQGPINAGPINTSVRYGR
jgi:hypothetical protein